MELNTREIAILVWLAVGIGWAIRKPPVRESLTALLRSFLNWRIQVIVWALAIYLALVVWALASTSLWDMGQLKNTIIWFVAVGLATLLGLPRLKEEVRFFRTWLSDNLKLIVVVEFLVTFYTFPLIVELIIQPILFFLFGMQAVASRNPKQAIVTKFIDGLLLFTGTGVFIYAAYMIVADFSNFATIGTVRDLYIPPVLSLLTLPLFFVLHVFMTYERVFSALPFKVKDDALRRKAKLSALLGFGWRTELLERWNRYIGAHRPKTAEDIRRAIQDVKGVYRRERRPVSVPPSNGWSPEKARHFLDSENLTTRDYHRQYDDEWAASSSYFEIGDSVLANNVAYYIDGDALVARRLRLVLNINQPSEAETAKAVFGQKCAALVSQATQGRITQVRDEPYTERLDHWQITLSKTEWSGGTQDGYELEFTIEVPETQKTSDSQETDMSLSSEVRPPNTALSR